MFRFRQTKRRLAAFAVVLCPFSVAAQSEENPSPIPHRFHEFQAEFSFRDSSEKATTQFPTGFQNPSFDQLSANGLPLDWVRVGSPLVLTEQQNSYVKGNSENRFQQEFIRQQNDQHVTFTGLARGDQGTESASVNFFQRSDFGDASQLFVGRLNSTNWQRFYFTADLVEQQGPKRFLIIPASTDRLNWVEWDDFGLITVGFHQGDFESQPTSAFQRWTFHDSEVISDPEGLFTDSNVLLLQPGGSVEQLVSILSGEHRYLIQFKAQAPNQQATVIVERVLLNNRGEELSTEQLFQQTIDAGQTVQPFFTAAPPPDSSSTVALYRFKTLAQEGELLLDDLQLGYALITPDQFNPSETSTYKTVQSLIVWPQERSLVELQFRNPQGEVERTVVHQLVADSFRDAWNPPLDLPPGEWTLEVDFGDGATTASLSLPWNVAPSLDYNVSVPQPQTEFEISAWLWLGGLGTTTAQLRPYIEQTKNDLIDYPVIFADRTQWAAVREICEELDYNFVAADFNLIYFYKRFLPSNQLFSEERFRLRAETELATILGSPNLQGLYLMDEPFGETQALYASLTNKVFSALSTPLDGYTIFATRDAAPTALETIKPVRYWTDVYPTQLARPNLRDNLLLLSTNLLQDVARAKSVGLSHALVCQAFEIPDSFRVGPPEMISATVGLAVAHGSQGLHPFAYVSIGNNEGVRNRALELLPYGPAWLEQLRLLQPIKQKTVLRESISAPVVSENLLYTTSTISGDSNQLVLTSLQPRIPLRVTLGFDSEVELSEPRLEESYQTINQEVTLDLEPGGWRYLEFPLGAQLATVESEQLPLPDQQLPTVPVAFQRSALNQNLRGIDYSQGEQNYAYVSTSTAYAFLGALGFVSGTAGTRVSDVEFLTDTKLIVADEGFGLYRVSIGFPNLTLPVPLSTRRTGNGRFLTSAEGYLINSMGRKGISIYNVENSIGEILPVGFTNQIGDARNVATIPGENAFYVIDQDFGVRLMQMSPQPDGQVELSQQLVYQEDRVFDLDYEPIRKQVAVARLGEGLTILQQTAVGEPLERVTSILPGFESIDHVQWISPNLLAAVEWHGDCFFIGRDVSGNWSTVAKWRSTVANATCNDVASNGSQLLLTFSTGQLVGLNTLPLQELTGLQEGWVFY